jgi:glycosyltransferase involved in cell wall biosynthesis
MNKKGLLVFLDSSPKTWGSREELHLRFSQGLIARGLRPILVFSADIPADLREKYQANGIEVESLSYAKGVLHFYRKLGQLIRKYSVFAIHIAFFNYFSLIPWMARLRGVKYIVYHERNPGVLRANSVKLWVLRIRTRIATHPISRVIAISEFIKQQLITVGVPTEKIYLVYNGIDTQRFSPDPSMRSRLVHDFSIRSDELIVSTLTYLNPHKNVDVLLEACAKLANRDVPVRLFVIGDGQMRRELEALGNKLGITDRIQWLGHIVDPVPILQASDVFVMASVGEGFGLAIAEAMACGAAAIATQSGALTEIAEHGRAALLLPPRDATALADAIQHLAVDEEFRRDLAQRGLERVRRVFSADASVAGLMQVYDSLLDSQDPNLQVIRTDSNQAN